MQIKRSGIFAVSAGGCWPGGLGLGLGFCCSRGVWSQLSSEVVALEPLRASSDVCVPWLQLHGRPALRDAAVAAGVGVTGAPRTTEDVM